MSCRHCGTDMTNLDLCVYCKEVAKLEEQITILKAERDEARVDCDRLADAFQVAMSMMVDAKQKLIAQHDAELTHAGKALAERDVEIMRLRKVDLTDGECALLRELCSLANRHESYAVIELLNKLLTRKPT